MIQRRLLPELRAALADTPVVVIHGPRQSGKTTLARMIAGERPPRRYLTFDDATTLAAAVADPAGFIAALDGPVVLDEVQRAPALFPAIKAEVDRRRAPGRFLLTGSANVLLVPRISESLAGRVQILTLWPFAQAEIEERGESFIDDLFKGRTRKPASAPGKSLALLDRILRGGYPEVHRRASADRRSAWFASYLTTILQRDVRDLAHIEGLTEMPRLLTLLASRTSGLLNHADLSRSLSMPQTTLKRYFALLEITFLIQTIPAWAGNLGLRLSKSPKVIIADTGLACHMLGLDRQRLVAEGNHRGLLTESFVAGELIKQSGWSATRSRLLHFRAASGHEVDLVLEDAAGRIVGVEVKSAASVAASDFNGLKALQAAAGKRFLKGVVLYDAAETIPFGSALSAVPISSLWTR